MGNKADYTFARSIVEIAKVLANSYVRAPAGTEGIDVYFALLYLDLETSGSSLGGNKSSDSPKHT